MHIAKGTIPSAGNAGGFLPRYDQDGETLWAKPIGGVYRDRLPDVASDSKGNVYAIGTVHGPVDVDRDGTVDVTVTGEPETGSACHQLGDATWPSTMSRNESDLR